MNLAGAWRGVARAFEAHPVAAPLVTAGALALAAKAVAPAHEGVASALLAGAVGAAGYGAVRVAGAAADWATGAGAVLRGNPSSVALPGESDELPTPAPGRSLYSPDLRPGYSLDTDRGDAYYRAVAAQTARESANAARRLASAVATGDRPALFDSAADIGRSALATRVATRLADQYRWTGGTPLFFDLGNGMSRQLSPAAARDRAEEQAACVVRVARLRAAAARREPPRAMDRMVMIMGGDANAKRAAAEFALAAAEFDAIETAVTTEPTRSIGLRTVGHENTALVAIKNAFALSGASDIGDMIARGAGNRKDACAKLVRQYENAAKGKVSVADQLAARFGLEQAKWANELNAAGEKELGRLRALSAKEEARLGRKRALTADDQKVSDMLRAANDERTIPPWMRAEAELDARILGAREGGGR